MLDRIEPIPEFKIKMSKTSIGDLWEDYHSNKEEIFFYKLDLSEFEDPSHPNAQSLQAWISEFEEDNQMMLEEIDARLAVKILPWLRVEFEEYLKKGGSNE